MAKLSNKNTDHPVTRERATKAAGWAAMQAWISRLVSLIVFVLLARLLEPKDFGLIAMSAIFINLVQVLLDQSLGAAIIQRAEVTPDHLDTAFWINIFMGCGLLVTIVALAEPISILMKEPALATCIRWLSITFVLGALGSVHQAIMTRHFRFKALALRSMIATLVSGVLAVVLAWLGYGVWSLIIQSLLYSALGTLLVWIGCEWRPRFHFVWLYAVQFWNFAAHTVSARILDFFSSRILDLLIGYIFGSVVLGFYAVGYRLVMVLNQMTTQVTSQISLSTFSRLQHDPARLRRAFYEATQLTCLIAFPLFIGLSLLAESVVVIVFGAKWTPAIPYLQILAFQGILLSITYFFGTALLAQGKPSWWLLLTIIDVILRLVAVIVCVQYGALAVVTAFTIATFITLPLGFILVRRLLAISLRDYVHNYKAPFWGTFFMVCTIFALQALSGFANLSSGMKLILAGLVGAITYLIGAAMADLPALKRVVSAVAIVVNRKRKH